MIERLRIVSDVRPRRLPQTTEAERGTCVLRMFIVAEKPRLYAVLKGMSGNNNIDWPNVKDEPRRELARLVRQHEA